ncbi:MAG: hypothetical protein ACM3X7_07905 [Solirubrobacterales bacterium]
MDNNKDTSIDARKDLNSDESCSYSYEGMQCEDRKYCPYMSSCPYMMQGMYMNSGMMYQQMQPPMMYREDTDQAGCNDMDDFRHKHHKKCCYPSCCYCYPTPCYPNPCIPNPCGPWPRPR